ncbi:MAG: hypothetical protein WAW17_07120 [Rhodococcus sp. (in: high G+C Gram-positive bacteria)]|uniref:hypothetical protein n=1 Tax=Rhodococcus sp. TaxID=1831 RepID=UPI003BB123AA
MTAVGMTSVAGVEAGAAAVSAIQGQINGTHEAVNMVASAILPPTHDSASATATVRQLTNVQQFSTMLRLGLAQQQALSEVVRAAAVTTAATDELNASALAAIPS